MSLIGSRGCGLSPGTRRGSRVVATGDLDVAESFVVAVVMPGAVAVLAACSACQGEGSGVAVRSSSQGGRCLEVVVESGRGQRSVNNLVRLALIQNQNSHGNLTEAIFFLKL